MKKFYLLFPLILLCFLSCKREKSSKINSEGLAIEHVDDASMYVGDFEKESSFLLKKSQLGDYFSEVAGKKLSKASRPYDRTDEPEMFAEMIRQRRTPLDRKIPEYKSGYLSNEYELAKKNMRVHRSSDAGVKFQEHGPGNVSGRSRAMLIDESDPTRNTWIAAAVGGGIWKTTDAGQTWSNLSADMPNLSISSLAWSESNRDIIYAGTGELNGNPMGLGGTGVFKSIDGGQTWNSIVDVVAMPDFSVVTRLAVHPEDPNTVIASGVSAVKEFDGSLSEAITSRTTAIYKSTDGGASWNVMLSLDGAIEDLKMSPFNPDVLMASHHRGGIYLSLDGGDTWEMKREGIRNSVRRLEIAPSLTDSLRWWMSGHVSRGSTVLLVSDDMGNTWQEVKVEYNGAEILDFLDQGDYDNAICAHPFDNNVVYAGGVSLFKFSIEDGLGDTTVYFDQVENGTEAFMDFVNFGGTPGNGFDYGDEVIAANLPDIELRFGQGSQMAHRFTVGGRGAGVPPPDYIYEDYVEVPFQVWDVSNNQQLMLSFRDQAENGVYDLIPQNTSGDPLTHSREYMFIHLVEYSESPDTNIARNGGIVYQQAYNNWPIGTQDEAVDLNNVESSSLLLSHPEVIRLASTAETVTDGTLPRESTYGGINSGYVANYLFNDIGNHPDQHFLYPQVLREGSDSFRLLIANDGGIHASDFDVNPGTQNNSIKYVSNGYLTTQVMSADKAPGVSRFIGGAIDNNVWFTADTVDGSAVHDVSFFTTGDGFGSVWNNSNAGVMWTSTQYNRILWSPDGGSRWFRAGIGLTDDGTATAPFFTKIATSKTMPEQVYVVGVNGVWRSDYYGFDDDFWELVVPDGNWTYNGSATDVEVSKVSPHVVIAGGLLSETNALHVSTDGGETFVETGTYGEVTLGSISGIESHPVDVNTIYTLFSFAGRPKVLRSSNLGQTWEDISGFESGSGESDRGFPDVAVNALFVFPNNTDRIWVGTEIGIVESLDNGASWNLLDCEMGAAPVWEFNLQDDQIVIATGGRGIWTATIEDFENPLVLYPDVFMVNVDQFGGDDQIVVNAQQDYDSLFVGINGVFVGLADRPFPAGFWGIPTNGFGELLDENNEVRVLGYLDGEEYLSLPYFYDDIKTPDTVITSYFNDFADVESSIMDFEGDLTIGSADGFNGNGIQSEHPYLANDVLIYRLNYPIAVEDQVLSFEDVALIEPGDSGTVFGGNNFWDFVVVEGLAKGSNEWVPLFDGYDARDKEAWLEAYNNGEAGSQDLLSFHSVPLTDVFETGDTILIRLRLFSDEAAVGWGWFVDYLSIESITTSTEELENAELSIYPNPVSNLLTIDAVDDAEIRELTIMDISGKVLLNRSYSNAQRREQIDVQSYPSGVYLVRVKTADAREVVKKIIVQ